MFSDFFWGNFHIALVGSFSAEAIRILPNYITITDPSVKSKLKTVHWGYYAISFFIVLGGAFFTALLFHKANDILYVESFIVGVMSKGFLLDWVHWTNRCLR